MQTATLTLPAGADLPAFLAISRAGATPTHFDHCAVAGVVVTLGVYDLGQLARIEAALLPQFPDLSISLN